MSNNPNTGKENEVKNRTLALVNNGLGLAPSVVGFDIKSDLIKQYVEKAFEDKGVDTNSDVFAVRMEWNSRFEECIRRPSRAPKNVPPFFVSVAIRRNVDDKTSQYSQQVSKVFRELGALMPNRGASAQALVMGDDKLKAAITMFNGNEKTNFEIISKSKNVIKFRLNPYKVIDFVLRNEVAPGSRYKYDIDIVRVYKNKNIRNPETFSFRILKQFKQNKYKDGKSMSDLFRK